MVSSLYRNVIPTSGSLPQSFSLENFRNTRIIAPIIRNILFLYNSIYSRDIVLHSTITQKTSYNEKRSKQLFGNQVITYMTGMEAEKTIDTRYNPNEILSIYKKISANCPDTIQFEETSIDKRKIVTGLCSAMTFTALRYILTKNRKSPSKRLKEIAKKFRNGTPQIVAETQAVFNAIEIKPDAKGDLKRDKMQSLANVFDLELTNAYPIVYGVRNPYQEDDLIEQLKELPEGAYCIRLLWTADNYKGEYVGHSLLYLKEKNEDYLFDPGMALILLNSKDLKDPINENRAQKVGKELMLDFERWGDYDEIRFYEVNLKAKS